MNLHVRFLADNNNPPKILPTLLTVFDLRIHIFSAEKACSEEKNQN